jgi:hypothetical protein
MADTNTQDQGDQATAQATPAKLYQTKADAEAAKPADAPKSLKPYEVTKAGASAGWVLARGYDHRLATVARIDGYSLSAGNTKEVSKEAVAAKLATFSDDELAALGLSRKPQKGDKR